MKALMSTFLLLLFLVGATFSYGKNTIYPGYIITLNNDTIHGYIDYKNWEKNPDEIQFKKTKDDPGSHFTTGSITEFSAANEIYKSAIVEIERSDFRTNELTLSPDLYLIVDTVFLRALIIGDKSLYYLKDERGKESFYIDQNSNYELLVYKQFLKEDKGKKYIVANNNYIGQLILYLQNCNTINKFLSETSYDQKSLVKAFNYYYDCTNTKMDFKEQVKKVKLNFSGLAGVNVTSLKFRGEEGEPSLTEVDFPISTNFTAGISLDIVLPRNFGRWSFNNEITFTSYSTESSYLDYTHENRYITTETELAFSYLKINTMLRGNFPIDKFVLFANIGFSNGFMISNRNYKKETNVLFNQVHVTEEEAISDLRKHEQSLLIGIGGKLSRFTAEFRYEAGNGMTHSNYMWSATNRFYFLFGYIF